MYVYTCIQLSSSLSASVILVSLSFPLSHFPCQVELPEREFSVSAADDVGDMLETSEEEVDPEAAK